MPSFFRDIRLASSSSGIPQKRIIDYKLEMISMLDNIFDLKVLRNVKVDLSEAFLDNLEYEQLQRVSELQTCLA